MYAPIDDSHVYEPVQQRQRMTLAPLAPSHHRAIQDDLRTALIARGFDGFLAVDTYDVVHLCGFFHSPNERPVGLYVPVDGAPVLFVPLLEKENAETCWVGDQRIYDEYPGEEDPILWMIRETGARRLAIDTIPVRLLEAARAQVDSLAISDLAAQSRWCKRPEELAFVRAAAAYADLCLEAIHDGAAGIIRAGGTELDILRHGVGVAQAALLRDHGVTLGATKLAITASVHSGPRAALPHGKTGARQPRPGDTLIAGIGCALGGYHAESGATWTIGAPDAAQRACLAAADAARDAAIAAAVPGASCAAVDARARAAIADAGFGQHLRHRIGHGMGLQGHEPPWLAPGDRTRIAPGMVFSNEPGIYRPGVDGYRTIETMIATAQGVDVPSRFQTRRPAAERVIEP